MSQEPGLGRLAQHFSKIRDPRADRTKRVQAGLNKARVGGDV